MDDDHVNKILAAIGALKEKNRASVPQRGIDHMAPVAHTGITGVSKMLDFYKQGCDGLYATRSLLHIKV